MLQIYNTLTKEKSPFTPIEEGKIKMYVCGVTVYDLCHIGHARVMVAFDVITRFMRSQGWDVDYVRNITDVDDKIIKRAAENGEEPHELTERMIAAMHEDEARLSVLRPTQEPRATAHIGDIISLVETLIEKGFAYPAANGDVYYRVEKFADYGKLTNKNVDELKTGARIEVEEAKESPLDFVLWKSAKEGEVSWDSPWGKGRPGWHIECSAMSKCCLGNTFDIHGGGPDLPFPHHENEIAQSEAANGCTYVNTWMHAGPVRVNSEKMSKSLGNFFTIRDVLEKYNAEVVRFFLARVHYRTYIDYSEDSLKEARVMLERFYQALRGVDAVEGPLENDFEERFIAAMNDDFNTPKAVSVMFELVNELNKATREGASEAPALAAQLRKLGGMLGLLQQNADEFLQGESEEGGLSNEEIEQLIVDRAEAKKAKNFAEADKIRDDLASQGIILKDSREGTSWFRES
ncbi:cysteine--tRNA ligase [Neptuniibacter caesariensis]|uniref:Cysteine--tRNA ligase n=1 Tax=Neptuniibacter caesariensis TaxID=207954 RepID=A0A7U8GSG1_NEPCE|nr:cysteine--tRNA ligase [Neptuniibacter caesariensis]EAR61222.1 Cysteinyl-tRNA synthetase, class Ia [Oceanospirillum sp. MED92] [Neptuniibacter caesariensis]